MHDRNRRFRRDPADLAPNIMIQDKVSHNQDVGLGKTLDVPPQRLAIRLHKRASLFRTCAFAWSCLCGCHVTVPIEWPCRADPTAPTASSRRGRSTTNRCERPCL